MPRQWSLSFDIYINEKPSYNKFRNFLWFNRGFPGPRNYIVNNKDNLFRFAIRPSAVGTMFLWWRPNEENSNQIKFNFKSRQLGRWLNIKVQYLFFNNEFRLLILEDGYLLADRTVEQLPVYHYVNVYKSKDIGNSVKMKNLTFEKMGEG